MTSREKIHFAIRQSSLGSVLVAGSYRGICAILLGDDPAQLTRDLQNRFPGAALSNGDSRFKQVLEKIIRFVETPAAGIDLPLDMRGTQFQQQVWQTLREIPAGSTASYAAIANRLGMPKAVRAVANACGANALAVVIPCHRVVKSNGDLSGYRWGVQRKRALLERESRA